jgi:hypothetical protein
MRDFGGNGKPLGSLPLSHPHRHSRESGNLLYGIKKKIPVYGAWRRLRPE